MEPLDPAPWVLVWVVSKDVIYCLYARMYISFWERVICCLSESLKIILERYHLLPESARPLASASQCRGSNFTPTSSTYYLNFCLVLFSKHSLLWFSTLGTLRTSLTSAPMHESANSGQLKHRRVTWCCKYFLSQSVFAHQVNIHFLLLYHIQHGFYLCDQK